MSGAGPIFVITGPSGVGKGTLISMLRERIPRLRSAISATTRQPRPGERDGVDYHFMSERSFADAVTRGAFVEHVDYAGARYGTLHSELKQKARDGEPVLLEIEVQGARQVHRELPGAMLIFIAPPSLQALGERLHGRGTDDPEKIRRRLEVAESELKAQPEFEHVIVNDELEQAYAELDGVVRQAMLRCT